MALEPTSLASMIQESVKLESALVVAAEQNAGEIDIVLDSLLTELTTEIESKVDRYKFVMDRLKSGSLSMKEQAEKFTAASRALKRASERLWDHMKSTMATTGKTELLGSMWSFKLSEIQDTLIIDEDEFNTWVSAAEYSESVTVTHPNKDMIREALQAGAQIPGCRLVPSYRLGQGIRKT